MKRVNVVQGTIDWHEVRYRKIGGSDAKGLFVPSDTLMLELLSEFTEDFEMEDTYQSNDMIRGTELEPYAIEELNKYTGLEFKSVGWLQCEEIPLLGISPDGITNCDRFTCETKCPAKKKHTETILSDEIPLDNLPQCIHYFTVNPKLEKHYFVSFRPENQYKALFVKELTRESLVDIGWTKKEKVLSNKNGKGEKEYIETVPDIRTVQEWVNLAKANAKNIQQQIDINLQKLLF
jgi:predicted phage-related endonuclease